jgi:hypothetical protein
MGARQVKNWEIEWGKLALILVLMLGGFGLVFIALIDENLSDDRFAITLALGSSIITGCMGYLFGNGRLAARGQSSVPTLAPPRDSGAVDISVVFAWLIIGIAMVLAIAGMSYLGGAVVCGL